MPSLRVGARIHAVAKEMMMMELPSLTGKTVLDVGALGGWFTFEAERRGAARVTALDYYSWTVDGLKLNAWISEQRKARVFRIVHMLHPRPVTTRSSFLDARHSRQRALF